ncbi:hypothetical protein [Streptomyces sp. NBC_01314]|uniref:hypothetical protein n=1 Tax=Streptomyces sp. NBC_01314 TaxID=2903821 RepID=UPI00308B480B|nr:hypothetical protein OG622_13060 [Streptomyces sp. NBC_01314]
MTTRTRIDRVLGDHHSAEFGDPTHLHPRRRCRRRVRHPRRWRPTVAAGPVVPTAPNVTEPRRLLVGTTGARLLVRSAAQPPRPISRLAWLP